MKQIHRYGYFDNLWSHVEYVFRLPEHWKEAHRQLWLDALHALEREMRREVKSDGTRTQVRLTEPEVIIIRHLLTHFSYSQVALAHGFGVHTNTISSIKQGKTHKKELL